MNGSKLYCKAMTLLGNLRRGAMFPDKAAITELENIICEYENQVNPPENQIAHSIINGVSEEGAKWQKHLKKNYEI